jgi:hypothetical protein
MLDVLRGLYDEFFASTARDTAADLKAMGDQAAAEFRVKHPELSESAVEALAWSYTFAYK